MSWDFSLDKYSELCRAIRGLPCQVMTLAQFLKDGQPQGFTIILRHDIDRALPSALGMAEVEANLGIRATYYARATRAVFRPEALIRLHQLGHEIGYHYEVLAKARGNHRQAILKFEQELEQFRQIVPVETISMHGSPLLPWDNRDLWDKHDFKKYGLLGEAYLSVDYGSVYYFTDTGRNWDATRHNLRDLVSGRKPDKSIITTDDLIAFLLQIPDSPVVINAHPERWTASRLAWAASFVSDWMANRIKRVFAWQHGKLDRVKR